jgi:hypothetical protein
VKQLLAFGCFILLLMPMPTKGQQKRLQSRAERTGYAETSRYADVMEFIAGLQQLSPGVKVETFARTNEGRALPLVILSNPAINSPAEAASSGKPIVFIMANIHAGEVEGKEASQHLMRDIVTGPLAPLLEKIIILVAPIYNADGNEKIDINNRTAQNGPATGVGTRENAQRLDLNRDFMKLKSPEARGLAEGVFNRWDPHVVIDLHTTNGSFHGYALTYSPSLNPNTDSRITSYVREKLLPDVTGAMKSKYDYRAYFYGNFVDQASPLRELSPEEKSDPKAWATFDNRPRFGNNYIGLRNRIAILSEAYSYLDFKTRVDVTDKFVRTILHYIADHPADITSLVRDADLYSIERGTTRGSESGFGVSFELAQSSKPVEILVGSITQEVDPRTNKPRFKATGEARPVKMTEFGEFRPTARIKPPTAYILNPDQKDIVNILLAHGISVEELKEDRVLAVEKYVVKNISRAQRAFQGQNEVKVTVSSTKARAPFPAGSFIVPVHQAKAALVFYLLEPQSDDGLTTWNYFDEELDRASKAGSPVIFPVYRLMQDPNAPKELMKK